MKKPTRFFTFLRSVAEGNITNYYFCIFPYCVIKQGETNITCLNIPEQTTFLLT